jgi:glucose/arabinose dehydrogenase
MQFAGRSFSRVKSPRVVFAVLIPTVASIMIAALPSAATTPEPTATIRPTTVVTTVATTTTTSATTSTTTTVVEITVPLGKGRTGPQGTESGTTLPAAPGGYKVVAAGRADQPVAIAIRPADKALYVAEKTGRVRPLKDGKVGAPVLDLSPIVSTTNEQGLLGLVFHPTSETRLFVDYTDKKGNVVIAEFTTNKPASGQPIAVDGNSRRVLMQIAKPFNEHNAGTLVFDKSGALLIGIGDGGGSGDPQNNAQRTDTLLGKVLRIIPDRSGDKQYGIPADNPFYSNSTAPKLSGNQKPPRQEVFAYGLRNPWRISVDLPTGDVWVPDVGQSSFEEVNRITPGIKGANFGWRNREGKSSYKGGAKTSGALDPLYDYPHADGRCAVVGGFLYRGKGLPALNGWYLFADVCSGQIMALDPRNKWRATSLGTVLTYPTSFAEGPDGEPWLMSFEGPIARLVKR